MLIISEIIIYYFQPSLSNVLTTSSVDQCIFVVFVPNIFLNARHSTFRRIFGSKISVLNCFE